MIGCVCDNIGCVGYSNYMDSHGDHMVVTTLIYIGCRVCVLSSAVPPSSGAFIMLTRSSALILRGEGPISNFFSFFGM